MVKNIAYIIGMHHFPLTCCIKVDILPNLTLHGKHWIIRLFVIFSFEVTLLWPCSNFA